MPCDMTWIRKGISVFFEYDTPRIVHIKSKKIGITSRLVQVAILTYVIGYVLVYQKGYQKFDEVESAVTTKVKGIVYSNVSDEELINVRPEWKDLYRRIWDVTDYVVPAMEHEAFFVTTNVVITPNQTKGECAEDPSIPEAVCDPDNNECVRGKSLKTGHGVMTGECVPYNSSVNTCKLIAWCPIEEDEMPLGDDRPLLEGAKDFTVLIKNQIEFPYYKKRRTNILESSNTTYLTGCAYDQETDPFCPVFEIGKIVHYAGENFTQMAISGGILSITIQWDCDLDHDFMSHCRPQYRFSRLDNPKAKIAPGWNFRHAQYYSDDRRTLYKSYGILFQLDVNGRAGKFNMIPTFLNLGAGLALLGITTVICDIFVLYFLKDRDIYYDKKYLQVKGSDAFNVYRSFENEGYSSTNNDQLSPQISSRAATGETHSN